MADKGRIEFKIAALMERDGITAMDLMRRAEIAYATARALQAGTLTRIDLSTLVKLCCFWGVGVEDLIEYIPPAPHSAT